MKDIFHYSPNVTHNNLYIHTHNATKFGNKSLRAFGVNIWNALTESCSMPEYIKLTTLLLKLKKITKTWPGLKYKCSICKWEWSFLLNMIFAMHNILQRWIQSTVKYLRWSYLWKQLMTWSHWKLLPQKGPPWIFDRVLTTHLLSLSYTYERGKVLGVDPLHKKRFWIFGLFSFTFLTSL